PGTHGRAHPPRRLRPRHRRGPLRELGTRAFDAEFSGRELTALRRRLAVSETRELARERAARNGLADAQHARRGVQTRAAERRPREVRAHASIEAEDDEGDAEARDEAPEQQPA